MIRRFLPDERGAVAAEFVLMLPVMLMVMFGGMEAGHFIWNQHNLVKAVREGARYASRLPVDRFCDGSGAATFDPLAEQDIESVVITGGLPGTSRGSGAPVVRGLSADKVVVEVACDAYASGDTGTGSGIYSDLGMGGPVVTVSVRGVPYPSLFEQLGSIDGSYRLTAKSSAAVIGL